MTQVTTVQKLLARPCPRVCIIPMDVPAVHTLSPNEAGKNIKRVVSRRHTPINMRLLFY